MIQFWNLRENVDLQMLRDKRWRKRHADFRTARPFKLSDCEPFFNEGEIDGVS